MTTRTIKVDVLSRVEGEGAFLFEALAILHDKADLLSLLFPDIKTSFRFRTDYILRPGERHIVMKTTVMLSEEYPEMNLVGPAMLGGTSMSIHLHVDDCDAVVERARAAGATVVRPPTDQFYGERSATVRDPFGHEWMVGHEIAALTPEEMQRRYDALFAPNAP